MLRDRGVLATCRVADGAHRREGHARDYAACVRHASHCFLEDSVCDFLANNTCMTGAQEFYYFNFMIEDASVIQDILKRSLITRQSSFHLLSHTANTDTDKPQGRRHRSQIRRK